MNYIGLKVKIKSKNHPHYEEIGTVVGEDYISILRKYKLKIKGEYNEFYADVKDLKVI